jgi:hypothetical protein
VVIDFEASGFGGDSYPIEVGYIGAAGERFCTLIQPQVDWTHWDRRAEAVHGLHRDLLVARGQSAKEVGTRLNLDLAGLTVYSDAWNHDLVWMHRLYEGAGLAPSFKLESILTLLTEEEAQHWQTMLNAVHRDVAGTRHRASTDAAVIQRALCLLIGIDPPPIGEDAIAPVD